VLIVQGEYEPLELARETETVVVRDSRKYYASARRTLRWALL